MLTANLYGQSTEIVHRRQMIKQNKRDREDRNKELKPGHSPTIQVGPNGSLQYNGSTHKRNFSAPTPNLKLDPSGDESGRSRSSLSAESKQVSEAAIIPQRYEIPELRSSSTKSSTVASADARNSGLPPTPPSATNSDREESASRTGSFSSTPQFADAVRNALRSEKSGVSTPTGRLLAPQTPDPSPPNRRHNSYEGHTALHNAGGTVDDRDSVHNTSNITREDSGVRDTLSLGKPAKQCSHTMGNARRNVSEPINNNTSCKLPDSSQHSTWQTNTIAESPYAVTAYRSPYSKHEKLKTPQISSPRLRHTLPTNLFLHQPNISFGVMPNGNTNADSWSLDSIKIKPDNARDEHVSSGNHPGHKLQTMSADDANDFVYRQIQTENAMRHTAIINGDAMAVSIIIPPAEKEKTLKRTTKRQSLRAVEDMGGLSLFDTPRLDDRPVLRLSGALPMRNVEKISCPKTRNSQARTDIVNKRTLRRSHGESQLRRLDSQNKISSHGDHSIRSASDPLSTSNCAGRTLRHFSHDARLESNSHVRRTSLEQPVSPHKTFDFQQPITTPMSNSQLSERTDVELCEARGVAIYPHNNKSVLVVDSGSRPVSKHENANSSESTATASIASLTSKLNGITQGSQPQSPPANTTLRLHTDSPLVNPRAAPEPPAFRVIPPTPIHELDLQLHSGHLDDSSTPTKPRRRQSLVQRARRYSESFVQPFSSRSRSSNRSTRPVSLLADGKLSPMWKPRGFWEDIDYIDDDYDIYGPPGHSLTPSSNENRVAFPRIMSIRMPGFRGSGGFLLGNSLDLDRHGSNKRRHHVTRPVHQTDKDDLTSRGRRFSLPFYGRDTTTYAGLSGLKERLNDFKQRKEEKKREERRKILKGQIHLSHE